nr:hypothetical protein [Paracoccus marcusii]
MPLALHSGGGGKQIKLVFIRRRDRALFGLHDEGAAPVKVDETARLRAGVDEGHRPFEAVIVILCVGRRGLGRWHFQKLGQLNGELLEIGPLAATRCLPASDEIINVQNQSRLF